MLYSPPSLVYWPIFILGITPLPWGKSIEYSFPLIFFMNFPIKSFLSSRILNLKCVISPPWVMSFGIQTDFSIFRSSKVPVRFGHFPVQAKIKVPLGSINFYMNVIFQEEIFCLLLCLWQHSFPCDCGFKVVSTFQGYFGRKGVICESVFAFAQLLSIHLKFTFASCSSLADLKSLKFGKVCYNL